MLVLLLIFFNAFFAASEMAFISVNINKLKTKNDKKSKKIVEIASDSTNFLSSIQVGVTLSGFLASAFASEAFGQMLLDFLIDIGVGINPDVIKPLVVVLITIILSYLTILLGELVPKKIAIAYPEAVANLLIRPILFFSKLFLPAVKFLSVSTRFLLIIKD